MPKDSQAKTSTPLHPKRDHKAASKAPVFDPVIIPTWYPSGSWRIFLDLTITSLSFSLQTLCLWDLPIGDFFKTSKHYKKPSKNIQNSLKKYFKNSSKNSVKIMWKPFKNTLKIV